MSRRRLLAGLLLLTLAGCKRTTLSSDEPIVAAPEDAGRAMADVAVKPAAPAEMQWDVDARLPIAALLALPVQRRVSALETRIAARYYDKAELSPAERAFFAVSQLDAEVNNGGFDQFFFNSSGDFAGELGAALRTVGLPLSADIFDRALRAFPGTPKHDIGERRAQMETLPEATEKAWSKLDDAWYARPESVSDALARFAIAHPAAFGP